MEKWRKKICLALLSIGMLAFAPVSANQGSCDPCDSCETSCWNPCDWDFCNFGGFEVGAEFLWWKPCVDDLDYAARVYETSDHTHVDYKGICPDWDAGVRVTLGLPNFFCNWDVCASYTYFESNDCASIDEENEIVSPLVHQGGLGSTLIYDEAHGSWDMTYHEWDILFAYDIACNPCHHFKPFFGVAGIVLDQGLTVKLQDSDTEDEIKWNSDFWGVGLRAGTCYTYKINDCISFYAKAHGTLLAGEADSTNHQDLDTSGENIILKDAGCCHFVPGYHIGAGFVYDTCVCNWNLSAKLGYEFLEWCNIPNHRGYTGDNLTTEASHATSASVRTLGFHGLVAGLALKF